MDRGPRADLRLAEELPSEEHDGISSSSRRKKCLLFVGFVREALQAKLEGVPGSRVKKEKKKLEGVAP